MEKENLTTVDEYGFGKLDTWLIDTYLRHKDETLEQAKARIAEEKVRKKAEKSDNILENPKTQTKL